MRLLRRRLTSDATPAAALLSARNDLRPVALIGEWAGGGAIIASEPVATPPPGSDPFAHFDRLATLTGGSGSEAEGVGGAWIGFIGYGEAAAVERLPPPPPGEPLPRSSFAFYDHLIRRDAGGQWWFEALWSEPEASRLRRRLHLWQQRLVAPGPRPEPWRCGPFSAYPSAAGHRAVVRRCIEHIHAGDLYQANITLRLDATLEGEAIDLFASSIDRLGPPYAAYIGDPGHQVVSFSPELFLERRGRAIRTAPIKGTAARPVGEPPEGRLDELARSEKNRAENVMIVDLMRNDLGRVCAYGSISATPEGEVRSFPGVWHIVSEVHGALRADVADSDLLRATFPPGSVTGAPKVKAMEVIAELESTGREAYTGAIGFASPAWGLELNVAIRTFEVVEERIWLGVGGGVVADSTPAGELNECMVKARPLVEAVHSDLLASRDPPASAGVPAPTRRARPRGAEGIFETLLVIGGHAQWAEAHCARLSEAAAALYDRLIDLGHLTGTVEALASQAAGRGRQRLRISLTPESEPELSLARISGSAVFPLRAASLSPLVLPGGLGEYKWRDRGVLDAGPAAGAEEPLILEADGEVLEAARGNIVAVEDRVLVTPPADGRILPGITRAAVLGAARASGLAIREERLSLDRLRAADEIFITSAIRIVQAGSLGAPQAPGPVTRAVASLLSRQMAKDVQRRPPGRG